jgi:superfamily II DNA or RNA helicase
MSNNLCVAIINNQIRGIVLPEHKNLYGKIPKTKMVNKTKIKNRIITDELIPYEIMGKKYLIPRFMSHCISPGTKVVYHPALKNYVNLTKTTLGEFNGEFSTKKQMLIDSTVAQLNEINGGLLQLGTGKGKTIIANKVIHHFGQNSIIFVYNEELQTQAYDDTVARFGDSVNIILLGGKKSKVKHLEAAQQSDENMIEYLGDKLNIFICVYMTGKKLNALFWKYVYLAIFDEAHCYCNSTGVNLLQSCKAQKVLGMTATPDYDWRSPIAEYWCGPIISGDTIIPDRNLVGEVTVIEYYGNKVYTEMRRNKAGTPSHVLMAGLLAEDPHRNQLIIDNIIQLLQDEYVIIVMSVCNDMLIRLNNLLGERDNKIKSGLLIGDTSKEDRVYVKRECNVIFTNYNFSRVGVNIPRATAMIFASPYKENGMQITGRVLRSDEPKVRKYIDIVDKSTYLSKQYLTRRPCYEKRGFTITEVRFKSQ